MIAQRDAVEGMTADQIATQRGIPLAVAKEPLTKIHPQRVCADVMYNSVYGTGASSREVTLTELAPNAAAVQAAVEKANASNAAYQRLLKNPAATPAQKPRPSNRRRTIMPPGRQQRGECRKLFRLSRLARGSGRVGRRRSCQNSHQGAAPTLHRNEMMDAVIETYVEQIGQIAPWIVKHHLPDQVVRSLGGQANGSGDARWTVALATGPLARAEVEVQAFGTSRTVRITFATPAAALGQVSREPDQWHAQVALPDSGRIPLIRRWTGLPSGLSISCSAVTDQTGGDPATARINEIVCFVD